MKRAGLGKIELERVLLEEDLNWKAKTSGKHPSEDKGFGEYKERCTFIYKATLCALKRS